MGQPLAGDNDDEYGDGDANSGEGGASDDESLSSDDIPTLDDDEYALADGDDPSEEIDDEDEVGKAGYGRFFTPDRSAGTGAFFLSLVGIVWIIAALACAAVLPLSLTAIIFLYLASVLVFLCCPCIGLMGAAATTAVWTIGLSFCALIVTLATLTGIGLSLLASLGSLGNRDILAVSLMSLVGHVILMAVLMMTGVASFSFEFLKFMMA